MTFQTHDLCGFRQKRFVRQFWRHLLILSFLTFPGYRWYASTYKQNIVCHALYTVSYHYANPQCMRRRIIVDAAWSPPPSSARWRTSTDKADDSGFLSTVWLAILVDPTSRHDSHFACIWSLSSRTPGGWKLI